MSCKTVLVIDDDEAVRHSIGDILQDKGYTPVYAIDGAQGLKFLLAQSEVTCVIVLDMMMPGMNGWQFLDRQRADPRLSGIPVIVCSAFIESGKSVRTASFLAKPVDTKRLIGAVEAFCA